jgi:hypothetical protein
LGLLENDFLQRLVLPLSAFYEGIEVIDVPLMMLTIVIIEGFRRYLVRKAMLIIRESGKFKHVVHNI